MLSCLLLQMGACRLVLGGRMHLGLGTDRVNPRAGRASKIVGLHLQIFYGTKTHRIEFGLDRPENPKRIVPFAVYYAGRGRLGRAATGDGRILNGSLRCACGVVPPGGSPPPSPTRSPDLLRHASPHPRRRHLPPRLLPHHPLPRLRRGELPFRIRPKVQPFAAPPPSANSR